MIEEIQLPCNETVIQKTLDGKFLVCLSEGVLGVSMPVGCSRSFEKS